LVRIVNGLTAKTEIGAPMACALLLGQPDHYTDREFKVLFWTSYARIVADVWKENSSSTEHMDESDSDRVIVNPAVGGFVPHKRANDYIYRPLELSDWCLIDFLSFTDVARLKPTDVHKSTRGGHTRHKSMLRFLPDHPNYSTHGIRLLPANKEYVINFIGPVLPRRDRGDREIYCRTMLTLFAPWRTGLELRAADQSWNQSFGSFQFLPHYVSMMNNMNVLYECRDASHDFAA
ncbi:hypothetical protein BDY19DRAFT_866070, partial [Irpex rosettiformis]